MYTLYSTAPLFCLRVARQAGIVGSINIIIGDYYVGSNRSNIISVMAIPMVGVAGVIF